MLDTTGLLNQIKHHDIVETANKNCAVTLPDYIL